MSKVTLEGLTMLNVESYSLQRKVFLIHCSEYVTKYFNFVFLYEYEMHTGSSWPESSGLGNVANGIANGIASKNFFAFLAE